MSPPFRFPGFRIVLAVIVVLTAALFVIPPLATRMAVGRLQSMAKGRGLDSRIGAARFSWPARFTFADLAVTRAPGDTVIRAESLGVELDAGALLLFQSRIRGLGLAHAVIRLPRAQAQADTLVPEAPADAGARDRAARLKRAAESAVRVLIAPARGLPRVSLADVAFTRADGDSGAQVVARLQWFDAHPTPQGVRMDAAGVLEGERPLPFDASVTYAQDDRLIGGARFLVPEEDGRTSELRVSVDGAVTQDRGAGAVSVSDTTRIRIGELPIRLGARLERRGPRVRLSLDGRGFDEGQVKHSLPPSFLGPLLKVGVRGTWDYRLDFDLDLDRPDSVKFTADVVPHGLALDPARTRLRLLGLHESFIAEIHLPGDRIVTRELSPANPHFRYLHEIAPALVYAVVTNEDGGFFRHRGFNTGAMREAIAENIRAGAFRRGAGTITMQLARNLYLGHDRTLSRKFREVVLAWILEHLTGTPKERLLEIYLNIIEWGPDVHGAGEAARFFFDRDPGALRVDEALFLATIVPAPRKWRYRFDKEGRLRPFVRAQMHFIGRAMIAKGWLMPEELPPADLLQVELRGRAREIAVPDSSRGVLDWLFGAAPHGTGNAGSSMRD